MRCRNRFAWKSPKNENKGLFANGALLLGMGSNAICDASFKTVRCGSAFVAFCCIDLGFWTELADAGSLPIFEKPFFAFHLPVRNELSDAGIPFTPLAATHWKCHIFLPLGNRAVCPRGHHCFEKISPPFSDTEWATVDR